MIAPESWPLSARAVEVIEDTARRHADDDEEAALMAERLSRAVARRIRRAAEATKVCPACGEEKRLDEYPRDSRSDDGRFWRCRPCHSYARRNLA